MGRGQVSARARPGDRARRGDEGRHPLTLETAGGPERTAVAAVDAWLGERGIATSVCRTGEVTRVEIGGGRVVVELELVGLDGDMRPVGVCVTDGGSAFVLNDEDGLRAAVGGAGEIDPGEVAWLLVAYQGATATRERLHDRNAIEPLLAHAAGEVPAAQVPQLCRNEGAWRMEFRTVRVVGDVPPTLEFRQWYAGSSFNGVLWWRSEPLARVVLGLPGSTAGA